MAIKKNISNSVKKVIAGSVLYLSFIYIILVNIVTVQLNGYPEGWYPVYTITVFIVSLIYLWLSAVINHILSEIWHVYSHKFLILCEGLELFYLIVIFIIGFVRYSLEINPIFL